MEIDVEGERAKYQAELEALLRQLQQLDQQRSLLVEAIHATRGVLAFLESLPACADRRQAQAPARDSRGIAASRA